MADDNSGGFLAAFNSMWGVGTGVAVAGPLALWAGDLQPPWPHSAAAVTTLFAAVSVVVAFVAGNGGARARKLGIGIVALGSLLLIAYLICYSVLVVHVDRTVDGKPETLRFATGWKLQPGVPPASDRELLEENNYDPAEVWTAGSLAGGRILVLLSFCIGFALLSAGLTLLAASHSGRKVTPPLS